MRISVFGLGYVGAVSSACFAKLGHHVVGVDPVASKVDMINRGESPVIETALDELIGAGVADGKIRATSDASDAVADSDLSLICVGTPSRPNGGLNYDYVARVCGEIGKCLASKETRHTVAVRSTILPHAVEQFAKHALEEHSGKRVNEDIGLAVNPEFLREGSAVKDFFEPPYTLVGSDSEDAAKQVLSVYEGIDAPTLVTDIKTASSVKYACNAFHALKVTFANEIGSFCKTHGIDSHKVMDIVCQDNKLNISKAYLKPGFAFGGSCLPKDLRAMLDSAREASLQLPTLSALLQSNEALIRRFTDSVLATKKRKIAILGLAFKQGTDDLRESPTVTVVETLIGKGCQLQIVDPNVSMAKLVGANKAFIEREIPHIAELLTDDMAAAVKSAEVVIVANKDDAYAQAVKDHAGHAIVFDLVRQFGPDQQVGAEYHGIAW